MCRSTHAVPFMLILFASFVLNGCGDSTSAPEPPQTPSQRDSAQHETLVEPSEETKRPREPSPVPLKKSALLVELPAECNTPDAMVLLPDGNIILSVPNFNDAEQRPLLMRVASSNDATPMIELPNHPETDKPLGPMGICVAPGGDLFFADYQKQGDRQSRVMRIVMNDGLPSEITPAILGLRFPNGLAIHNDHLYVTETQIDPEARPAASGIFRFALKEIDGSLIKLADEQSDDPHLIAKFETRNEELPLGAAGLAFDEQGNLYVGNLGDGTIHRIAFDNQGKVNSNEIFAQADFMKSADGLAYDPGSDIVYVADPKANAVRMILPDGSVQTLADSDESDGLDGGLDQPVELLVRGRELIVSNMDWPELLGGKYDKPCTLSVIKLDD
jgi:sugar lactone lactonase YvrE